MELDLAGFRFLPCTAVCEGMFFCEANAGRHSRRIRHCCVASAAGDVVGEDRGV